MMKIKNSLSLLFFGFLPAVVWAHGVHTAEPIDFSLPFNYYVLGSIITVAVSFFLIGLFAQVSSGDVSLGSVDLTSRRWVRSLISSRLLREGVSGVSLLFFMILLCAGFFGSQESARNIIPTGLWVFFGVGLTYFIMVFGNIWPTLNPCATVLRWAAGLSGKELSFHRAYPAIIGVWPAVLQFFLYRWLENIFKWSEYPRALAVILLCYLLITLVGMIWFGVQKWLDQGDPFGVFFRLISKVSILNTSENQLLLGVPGFHLLQKKTASLSESVFVLLMLAAIAYDSLQGTAAWEAQLSPLIALRMPPVPRETIGFIVLTLFFIGAYFIVALLVELFSGRTEKEPIPWRNFAFTFLPIAAGYEIAHYASFFLTEGQRIIPLLSDPFGYGWNIFGTAAYQINTSIINPEILWRGQVLFIVLGHVISVIAAHSMSLYIYKHNRQAVLSQIPMIILMLCYTVFSLWIIAQPAIG